MKKRLFGAPEREVLSTRPSLMINEISRLFFDRMRATDPPGGLSQHGCRLMLLALVRAKENEGRAWLSQRELADATHLRAPTVSVMLREMESEGLVSRRPHERDARTVCIFVTEKGQAAHEEIGERIRTLDKALMQGLNEKERDTLGRLLLRVRNNALQFEKEEDTAP